jgi:hypothetical protein
MLPGANRLDDLFRTVSMTLKLSLPALATTSQRPFGDSASAPACRPVINSQFGLRPSVPPTSWLSSIIDTDPSLAMPRASTHVSMPRPAGPTTLSAPGRLPPKLLT